MSQGQYIHPTGNEDARPHAESGYSVKYGVSLARNESAQNVLRAVLKLLFRPSKNTESILNMHKS